MHKNTLVNITLAALLLVGFAGCSTTGGDIGGLFPAPKFLKGSIDNNIYTSKDNNFTIAVPHAQGSYEYKYMQVKEEYHNTYDYVSFGPAAFDQSIYRVEVVPRAPPGEARPSLDEVASKFLTQVEQMMQNAYGAEPAVIQNNKTQINGRNALYWQLKQVVPTGKLNSSNPVNLTHDIYVIDFGDAVGIVWAQIQAGAASSSGEKPLTPEQFASSLKIRQLVYNADQRITAGGVYTFAKYPVTVISPAALCNKPNLAVFDTDSSVDFGAPDRLWQTAGDYAVQVFPIPDTIKDQPSFVSETKKLYPPYMAKDRKTLGLSFKVTDVKELQVGGLPALQGIGVDEGKAVFVVTAVLQKSSVTLASVIYPISAGISPTDSIPWDCYNKFVASVHELD